MARRRNARLAHRMHDLGYTMEGLAHEVNRIVSVEDPARARASKRWVAQLLSGETLWPRAHYRTALAQIFRCGALDLGFTPPLSQSGVGLASPIRLASGRVEVDVDRRHFLYLTSVTGAVISLPDVDFTGRVGLSDLERLRAPLAELRVIDQGHGAVGLASAAVEAGAVVSRLLHESTMSSRIRREAHALHGEYMTAAAWFALDADDSWAAGRYLDRAHTDAALAGDPLLQASIWNVMAYRASEDGHWGEVLAIAQAAMSGTAARRVPRASAVMHGWASRSYAAQGYRGQSSRAIGRAHEALTKESQVPEAPWLGFVDHSEIDAFASNAARQLGDYRRADDLAQVAIAATPPARHRNRLSRTLMSIQARLGATEIESAAHIGQEPLDRLPNLRSGRLLRRIKTIRDEFELWHDVPAAQRWIERHDQAITA